MEILKFNDVYEFYNQFETVTTLPNTVLNVQCDIMGNHSLRASEPFKLPSKIYSNDKDFINHVVQVFKAGDKSVGIALLGKKGLGKSFTAKVICQQLGLPVINVSKVTNDGVFDFLNKIQDEHIVYIDEFEKLFSTNPKNPEDVLVKQDKFLSFLDGSITSTTKRLFIITANDDISEFLLNRPSRIRYLRTYSVIHPNVIDEIISDKLLNEDFKKDLIDNLDVDELNVDSLIEIINEINISQVPYSVFKSFFNYQVQKSKYELYIMNDGVVGEFVGSKYLTESRMEDIKGDECYMEFGNDEHTITNFLKEDNMGNLLISGYVWADNTENPDGPPIKVESEYILKRTFNKLNAAI